MVVGMRKAYRKYIFLFILLFICSFIYLFYKEHILDVIKFIISSKWFILSTTFIVFCITILHKIKFNEISFNDFTNLNSVKKTIPEIISIVTEPSTFVCSGSIIKGLFLDYFYSEKYFFKFNDAEKSFLLIAAFYFLVFTFLEIKGQAKEIFFDSVNVENTTED